MSRIAARVPLAAIMAACLGTVACLPPAPKPAEIRPGPTPDAPHIVILQSTTNAMFKAPVSAFIAQAKAKISLYDRVGDNKALLVKDIRNRQPSLIFTLGTKATMLAVSQFPDVPVMFTMVVNYKRLGIDQRDNVMGIALESATVSEFSQFKMVLPTLRRVLAFYVPKESQNLVDSASAALRGLSVELVPVPVDNPAGVEQAYHEHSKGVDAVWLINDPVLMNKQTFHFLRSNTMRDKLPLIASLSDEFAKRGALMSVSTELSPLGAQAAAIAHMNLSQGKTPKEIGIQPPISTKLVLNMKLVRALDVEILDDAIPFVDELLNEQEIAQP